MQFTFLDMKGQTLFIRDDAERADWTVEELSLDMDFPYKSDKVIDVLQRVYFIDPATGDPQIYEVKTPKSLYDGVQQVHAEHICISELSDEHIDSKDIEKKTCTAALSTVLSGTLWKVGTAEVNPTSSVQISRGGVWQAVLQIIANWNVYIEPRVSLSSTGQITRYLDIKSTNGTWRGLRLSIDKNMLDPAVTYDDSETVTALFGYGGTIQATKDKESEEVTFADVVWSKTSAHPAKPKGQKYLEDPEATKKFGRNGRPRYGYYANTSILDPNVLLEKTWEALKQSSSPAISVEGTVADLYRMGYADQPIRLHDIALIEVSPIGFTKQLQIIRLTVNLLDPSQTTPTIGAYIPNIIYIDFKTNKDATGSRGGGGGNKSTEPEKKEFEAHIESINAGTALRMRAFQRDMDKVQEDVMLNEAAITVEHNRITQEVTQRAKQFEALEGDIVELDGKITVEAGKVQQIVSAVGRDGKVTAASITLAINSAGSSVKIDADHVDVSGILEALEVWTGNITGNIITAQSVVSEGAVSGDTGYFSTLSDVDVIDFDGHYVSWKSFSYTDVTLSGSQFFLYTNSSSGTTPYGSRAGKIVTASEQKTIYYLGR